MIFNVNETQAIEGNMNNNNIHSTHNHKKHIFVNSFKR